MGRTPSLLTITVPRTPVFGDTFGNSRFSVPEPFGNSLNTSGSWPKKDKSNGNDAHRNSLLLTGRLLEDTTARSRSGNTAQLSGANVKILIKYSADDGEGTIRSARQCQQVFPKLALALLLPMSP